MSERIALGFGDNIDYEIAWDSQVIEAMIVEYGIHAAELSIHQEITSERALVISILSFLCAGSGGERFVAASTLLEHFAQNFATKITLGGTSVRAAVAMRKLGFTSALHLVTINDHVRRLIPADSPYVCSNPCDTLYPHLIVQFGKNTRVCAGDIDICSRRANRIIYHTDTDNILMHLNEEFAGLLTEADVLLVSGFNAMQNKGLFLNRLQAVLRMMERLPKDALVFCEDAAFHTLSFSHLLYSTLAHKITVVSLNEDELQAHLNRQIDPLNTFQMKQALIDLQKLIPAPVLVVHSMDWALAYGVNAASMAKALTGGVTLATTRYCYGDDFSIEEYNTISNLPRNGAGATFACELEKLLAAQLCCVPVPHVEPAQPTTVGLGDAFVGGFLSALVQ